MGKIILVVLQHLGLLSFPVYNEEKQGKRPAQFPARYPNALAQLLVPQLGKLERYNAQRRQTARYFEKKLSRQPDSALIPHVDGALYLRFPLLVPQPQVWQKKAKQQGILLGNWYHNVIDPVGVDFGKTGYHRGSCPKAEEVSKRIVNLPTRIHLRDAQRIVSLFNLGL